METPRCYWKGSGFFVSHSFLILFSSARNGSIKYHSVDQHTLIASHNDLKKGLKDCYYEHEQFIHCAQKLYWDYIHKRLSTDAYRKYRDRTRLFDFKSNRKYLDYYFLIIFVVVCFPATPNCPPRHFLIFGAEEKKSVLWNDQILQRLQCDREYNNNGVSLTFFRALLRSVCVCEYALSLCIWCFWLFKGKLISFLCILHALSRRTNRSTKQTTKLICFPLWSTFISPSIKCDGKMNWI